MKKLILVAASMASLLAVVPANAVVITLEPDDYAVGTNVSHIQEGLTVSTLRWPGGTLTRSDVFVQDCSSTGAGCATGTRDFGSYIEGDLYENCVAGFACTPSVRLLEFAFDAPVSYFELQSTWLSDPPLMWAVDSLGARIDLCGGFGPQPCLNFTSTPDGGRSLLWFDHATPDISRVVVGGTFGTSRIDRMSAHNVPEPGTLALMGGALALTLFGRRLKLPRARRAGQ